MKPLMASEPPTDVIPPIEAVLLITVAPVRSIRELFTDSGVLTITLPEPILVSPPVAVIGTSKVSELPEATSSVE